MVRAKTTAGQGTKALSVHRSQAHHHPSKGNYGSAPLAKGGFDGQLAAPWRKTVSIFKQPVTLVHTTARETKPAPSHELQAANKANWRPDKPKQVFWAKRLQNLRAMMPVAVQNRQVGEESSSVPEPLSLPSRIQAVGPDLDDEVAAASLNSCLQGTVQGQPVTGQTKLKKDLEANPGALVNPDQPLVQAVVVTEQDVSAQERRVLDMRRRLEESLKHFPL